MNTPVEDQIFTNNEGIRILIKNVNIIDKFTFITTTNTDDIDAISDECTSDEWHTIASRLNLCLEKRD